MNLINHILNQGIVKGILELHNLSPSLSLLSSPYLFPLLCILKVGPFKSRQDIWGGTVSSPSGVWGVVPVDIKFGELAFFP